MTSKRNRPKTPPRHPRALLRSDDPILKALKKCADAQDQLTRASAQTSHWQHVRREAVRQAFAAGAGAREIAATVQVSRTKIYQLIGSARARTA